MTGCSALHCTNSSKKGYFMKRFPKDLARRKEWHDQMRRGNWVPTDNSSLCEVHFAADMWEKTRVDGKRKLRFNAVPTLFSYNRPKPTVRLASRPTRDTENTNENGTLTSATNKDNALMLASNPNVTLTSSNNKDGTRTSTSTQNETLASECNGNRTLTCSSSKDGTLAATSSKYGTLTTESNEITSNENDTIVSITDEGGTILLTLNAFGTLPLANENGTLISATTANETFTLTTTQNVTLPLATTESGTLPSSSLKGNGTLTSTSNVRTLRSSTKRNGTLAAKPAVNQMIPLRRSQSRTHLLKKNPNRTFASSPQKVGKLPSSRKKTAILPLPSSWKTNGSHSPSPKEAILPVQIVNDANDLPSASHDSLPNLREQQAEEASRLQQITYLELKILKMDQAYRKQLDVVQRRTKELRRVRDELRTITEEYTRRGFPSIFNADQMEAVRRNSNRCVKWSSDTIAKAIKLKCACGKRGYLEILRQNLPYPSLRTLRRRKIDSGRSDNESPVEAAHPTTTEILVDGDGSNESYIVVNFGDYHIEDMQEIPIT